MTSKILVEQLKIIIKKELTNSQLFFSITYLNDEIVVKQLGQYYITPKMLQLILVKTQLMYAY